jgi:hypothetical protein
MSISAQTEGRRTYITGNTYPIREQLRSAGAHWDGERKAWWLGDRKKAEELVARLDAQAEPPRSDARRDDRLADDTEILGKAKYKGKTYILVWCGETRRGRAAKLAFSDGSKVFWADESEIEIVKVYRPGTTGYGRYAREERMTFGRLRRLQEEWRSKSEDEHAEAKAVQALGGRCRCAKPLDEGDGECMYCGYFICD